MAIFSDPSIPELVLLDAAEPVLLDTEELVHLDAGEAVLLVTLLLSDKVYVYKQPLTPLYANFAL